MPRKRQALPGGSPKDCRLQNIPAQIVRPASNISNGRLWPLLRAGLLITHGEAHGFAEPHESLDALLRVLEQIIGWPPHPRLAKHHNSRAAEAEHRLFLAALERGIKR